MIHNLAFIVVLCHLTLTPSNAVMVKYGTSSGPIEPKTNFIPTPYPRNVEPSSPAPVSEAAEDLPNPTTYRPLIPHQYRTKLYSYKPKSNLIFGTPLDAKYTPGIGKYDIYKKMQLKRLDLGYTGPNLFEKQDYENLPRKTFLNPSVSYVKPQYYEKKSQAKYVPEIGVVYSSGVKYYVPQIFFQYSQIPDNNQENSVYDVEDRKYFYRTN